MASESAINRASTPASRASMSSFLSETAGVMTSSAEVGPALRRQRPRGSRASRGRWKGLASNSRHMPLPHPQIGDGWCRACALGTPSSPISRAPFRLLGPGGVPRAAAALCSPGMRHSV
jgi:hypothetical protein